ncbi:hypothetical protein SAMN04488018_10339 [Myroides marinus]|uniref:Uncharacterized protein n=1 Tax=Myroides marinus TaxID=703342 RepID=A0A1H6SWG9_9FLAO|nr:hypothetical protein SAMN04488018_10339 [Myroides marinus]
MLDVINLGLADYIGLIQSLRNTTSLVIVFGYEKEIVASLLYS